MPDLDKVRVPTPGLIWFSMIGILSAAIFLIACANGPGTVPSASIAHVLPSTTLSSFTSTPSPLSTSTSAARPPSIEPNISTPFVSPSLSATASTNKPPASPIALEPSPSVLLTAIPATIPPTEIPTPKVLQTNTRAVIATSEIKAPTRTTSEFNQIDPNLYLGEQSSDLSSIRPNPDVAGAQEKINNTRLLGLYRAAQKRGGYTQSYETFVNALAAGNGPTFDIYVTSGNTITNNKAKVKFDTNRPVIFVVTSNKTDAIRGLLIGRDRLNPSDERYAVMTQNSDGSLTIKYYFPENFLNGHQPNGKNGQVGLAFRNSMALLGASDEIQTGAGGENAYVSWTKTPEGAALFRELRESLFQIDGNLQTSSILAE